MSCEDNTCGTGIGNNNVPKPGDPDNNVALSANTVYGGINVSWTYPTINPHAVAHTILYRNSLNNFGTASELAKVGGSIYYDRLDPENNTTYWYWIRIRTVNGTLLDPVGPVSAIAQPVGPQTLETLTNLIDNGVLAQSLKESIAGINLQGQALLAEIEERIAANDELSALIALVQSGQQESFTYIQQEITQRTTADGALVDMLNTIASGFNENLAVIFSQLQVLTNSDGAMASQITQLFVKSDQNAAAIQNESTVRANAISAMATQVTTLTSRVGSAEATLVSESNTRASADNALSSRITSAEASLNGNIATVQTNLQAQVTTVNGKVTEIGALWTAKVQVNNLIGGFGVYNNGQVVEAGFDVDRFWIGRTGPDKVKPFIVDNGIVYIDKARIRTADIDTLKIAGNSVVTGVYSSSGQTNIPSSGQTDLITRSLNLGDSNNSGLIVSATVRLTALNNETVGFRILINGVVSGDQRVSARDGYGILVPVSGFNAPGTGVATVILQGYSPGGGEFTVEGSTMSILGGKR
jgi:hypothetical protein